MKIYFQNGHVCRRRAFAILNHMIYNLHLKMRCVELLCVHIERRACKAVVIFRSIFSSILLCCHAAARQKGSASIDHQRR